MKRLLGISILVAVVAVISFLAGSRHGDRVSQTREATLGRKVIYYVDPMNPSHTSDKPGLAPCGMNMEPVYADDDGGKALPPGVVKLSLEKQQLIGVQTGLVERKPLGRPLRILGKVAPDENRVFRITAAADGWIAKVQSQVAGSRVAHDEILATYYTPGFASAAQTLLMALGYRAQVQTNFAEQLALRAPITQNNVRQYRDSLKNLGVSDRQIEEMIETRELPEEVKIVSPVDGFVVARNVSQGQRFERGAELYRIVDLSRVWILADLFEKEAGLVPPDAKATVTLRAQGKFFPATLSQTLPLFDETTRSLKLRFEAENPGFVLKPDMFVDLEVPVSLPETIVVPVDALLDAGLRQTVFVDQGNGCFEPRVVRTGQRSGDEVQVLHGLMVGERIVISGNFLIDSETRMKLAAAGVHGAPEIDPVCGMAVDEQKVRAANRTVEHGGKTYFFCCDSCQEEFKDDPAKFLESAKQPPTALAPTNVSSSPVVNQDPVCGMSVSEPKARAAGRIYESGGKVYLFCNDGCKEEFMADPNKFLKPAVIPSATSIKAAPHRDQPHH